jgi:hypothetical protein
VTTPVVAVHLRRVLFVLRRYVRVEHVRRFADVIVDADEEVVGLHLDDLAQG